MLNKKAFTLIELLISITIVIILMMVAYAPYNYYQNKAKLKITAREVSQLLYESKNMAVNWAIWINWNVSIWVYFDTDLSWNNKIKVFSYPYNIQFSDIDKVEWWNVKLLKEYNLKNWVILNNIEWKNDILFLFESITWDLSYYTWESNIRNTIEDDIISLNFSYKWSDLVTLNKTINYFTSTNIIDY